MDQKDSSSLTPLTIKNPETGVESTVFIDYKSWQVQKDFYAHQEFLYWKYFSVAGTPMPIQPEDEFDVWVKRGKPGPALFNRA
jgi:hypothetical protein